MNVHGRLKRTHCSSGGKETPGPGEAEDVDSEVCVKLEMINGSTSFIWTERVQNVCLFL